jgi:hypothetical protein
MNTVVTTPTEELVRAACVEFDRQNSVIEEALTELFSQYPDNSVLRHVLLKVVALNSLYSTQIGVYCEAIPNIVDVARHIHQNFRAIDAGLGAHSPEVVDRIAMVIVSGKKDRNYFSFATKYCSWHKLDWYPIWDSKVDRYLRCLQKQTGFAKEFDLNAHWKYTAFRDVMSAFSERYGLASFSFKEIDKFLWSYGGK